MSEPGRHRRGAGQVPHQGAAPRRRRRDGRGRGPRSRGVLPVPAVLRHLRAGRHHGHRVRRRDHRISYTCACGTAHGHADRAGGREAGLEGRLADALGLRARDVRPAGADHSSPGSSFTVGGELVSAIFGGEMPLHFGYSFVGTSGSAKLSGSQRRRAHPGRRAGDIRGAAAALAVRAAPPEQSITLAFDAEVGRIYDEWDALSRRMADGQADPAPRRSSPAPRARPKGRCRSRRARCRSAPWPRSRTSPAATRPRSCGSCATWAVNEPVASLNEVRPRLDCAQAWVTGYVRPEERTRSASRAGPGPAGRADR